MRNSQRVMKDAAFLKKNGKLSLTSRFRAAFAFRGRWD